MVPTVAAAPSAASRASDAEEIYRRFCAAPLRLKVPRVPGPANARADDVPEPSEREDDGQEHTPPEAAAAAGAQSPVPAPTSPAVQRRDEGDRQSESPESRDDISGLREDLEIACRLDDPSSESTSPSSPAVATTEPPTAATLTTTALRRSTRRRKPTYKVARSSAEDEPMGAVMPAQNAEPPAAAAAPPPPPRPRKSKRVTRAVPMVNANTGGLCVDTPTKAALPPKRSRRTTAEDDDDDATADAAPSLGFLEALNAVAGTEHEATEVRATGDAAGDVVMDDASPSIITPRPALVKSGKTTTPATSEPKAARTRTKRAPTRGGKKKDTLMTTAAPVTQRRTRQRATTTKTAPSTETESSLSPTSSATPPGRRRRGRQPRSTKAQCADTQCTASSVCRIERLDDWERTLVATKTTSGLLFAWWMRAIHHEYRAVYDSRPDVQAAIEFIHGICLGVSTCEAVARDQPHPDHGHQSSAHDSPDERLGKLATSSTKTKSVRFRHFDLSALSLHYVENEDVAHLVEHLLLEYDGILTHASALNKHSATGGVVSHIINLLQDLSPDLIGNMNELAGDTEDTLLDALVSVGPTGLAELRTCQSLFYEEFLNLLDQEFDAGTTASRATPRFLTSTFSTIVASLIRHRLRMLFLPFDPDALVDEDQSCRIATYEHQDFGAAIHRALREMHQFEPLALAALNAATAVISDNHVERAARVQAVVPEEDLVHVEQFILASRFLRLSFSKCIVHDTVPDQETHEFRVSLERVCAMARRFDFEDEVHLFPLADLSAFVTELERRETALQTLEQTLAFVPMPHYEMDAPCKECNEIVTREEHDQAITCGQCNGRFHLACLHLPPSFAQFAGRYTCPFCYVRRPN